MNGILLINKEKGYTSRDIVNIVGKYYHTKKVGHTGTLDPLATGILIICVGEATKLVELFTNHDKEYIADITFGIESDTLDITGNILSKKECIISKEKIEEALKHFEKTYNQEVPIYSAVKINGKKLYEYARNGEEVTLPTREVTIYKNELLKYETIDNNTHIKIKCSVSKGTYIRSLIRDIATYLNTSAIMTDLKRIKVDNYKIEDSILVNELENANMITIEEALNKYPKIEVDGSLEFKIKNGCKIKNEWNYDIVLFKSKNEIIGLYKKDEEMLKPYKMFIRS